MSDILSSPLPITISQLRKDYIERARAVGLQPIVLMDGSLSCEIAIVGEAPGVREVELGSPFVGGSGALLWNNLRKIGITREKVYTTNVIKRQVSLSERGNARATIGKSELQHWESLLRWELSQLPNLKYVLILGAYALHSLMAIDGVTNWRGSRLVYVETSSLRSLETLVTYNPAMVLREPKTEIVFATDIKKFDRLLRGDLTHPQIKAHYDLSPQGVHELCDRLQDENLPISFDIETMHGETACIGISNSETEGWCVNFRTLEEHFYSSSDELRVRLRLQSLLGAADQRLVAQNGNFDMYWMWYKDRIRANRVWFDTLLAHHTLYPQLPHGLGFLTTVYTDHPYYKDEGKTWREGVADINKFWEYNVKDVCITLQVQRKLLKELEDQKLDKYFFDHVMHLQPHLAKMTVHGVLCDTKERDKLAEQSAAETVTALDDFHSALGRAELSDPTWRPNIRSINDMKRLYLRELKLVARGDSVDDENRDRMLKHPSTPETAKEIILAHNRYAKAFKFNSTYARIPLDNDSRFRSEYKQYGTQKAPGRLSSSSTLWGSGTNLQNQPPRARSMFIADPGFVFGYFDLSQAEARYVAWDANIESWKSQFEKARIDGSYDAHRALAATMFRVPYDQTPTKDEIDGKYTIRYIAKRCLTPDHEVLTKTGWASIAEAALSQDALATPTGWERPTAWFSKEVSEQIILFEGESLSQSVTPDHEMPLFNNGKLGRRAAKDIGDYGGCPITCLISVGTQDKYARLRAIAWADGSLEQKYPNSVRVSVAKERKAIRLRKLVSEHPELRLWESFSGGMWHFRIYGIHFKALSGDMLSWDLDTRCAFLEELPFWDGDQGNRCFNTDLSGLEIIQAVAHISGLRASICLHGHPKSNEKQCYVLRLMEQQYAHYESIDRSSSFYTGKVFCPTVPSGRFLVRRNGKVSTTFNCRHGLNYRMGPDRLATTTGLPLHECLRHYQMYHHITPELQRWWQRLEREVRQTRCLFNSYGGRLLFMQRLDDAALESIVAYRPQSSIGVKVSRVMYQCQEDDNWPLHTHVLLNVHDSLTCLGPPDTMKTALAIMKRYAEEPVPINGEQLIIPADLAISEADETGTHRWSTLKKIRLD
jgi:uracil-DNA glycosylase family 4